MIEALLGRLGLDKGEVKTYLTLLEFGPATAGTLARTTGAVRVTQYLFLKRLIEKGFVVQSMQKGFKLFTAEPAQKLVHFYEKNIQQLKQDKQLYEEILPSLTRPQIGSILTPKFQIFEGVNGLENVLKNILLYRDIETYTYWPIKQMLEVLSPAFFAYHNDERIARNISVQAIWPEKEIVSIKSHPYLGTGKAFKREIRIAPPESSFTMGYWIYGNNVAFLSSRKESYGCIVESREMVDMLRSQHQLIWQLSKPLKEPGT